MSIVHEPTIVKYGRSVLIKKVPPEAFFRAEIDKAKSSLGVNSKICWRVGFLLRTGQVNAGGNGTRQVEGHTCRLRGWSCTCGVENCEHLIASAILYRWHNLVDGIPAEAIITWLAQSIRGRRGVELTMRMQTHMINRFGQKPRVQLLSYTLDGETVDVAGALVVELDYFTFHRIVQENGIEEGLATDTVTAPTGAVETTYHLQYKGFFDLLKGRHLDVRPVRIPSPVDHLSQNRDYWQTTHRLNDKNRGDPVPMTGAS